VRVALRQVLPGVLLLGVGGILETNAPPDDTGLLQLRQARRQLQDQRAAVVTTYGPQHRAARLVEHHLHLVDEQITLRQATVQTGHPHQGG